MELLKISFSLFIFSTSESTYFMTIDVGQQTPKIFRWFFSRYFMAKT